MTDKLVLVDGNSLMHRSFHALPLLDNGEGVYTNAVYGFLSMLFRVLREENPRYCAVAFDLHGPTFRHEEYAEYKAGRAATPDELRPQFALIKELLGQMHVRVIGLERYEADDVLGTLSKMCEAQDVQAVLVTGDRDAFQLAGPRTVILYTKRGISETERVTPEFLREKYDLTPSQMIDLKGLMGDSSDNIPGVPGVGEKTALKLLHEHGTLERVLDTAEQAQKGKLRERLIEFADQARFSKRMATIERDAPLDTTIEDCRLHDVIDGKDMIESLKLKTLTPRLMALPEEMLGAPVEAAEPREAVDETFEEVAEFRDLGALTHWVARQDAQSEVAFAASPDAFSVALASGRQIRCARGGDLLSPGLEESDVLRALAPLLAGSGEKIVCDIKALRKALDAAGVALGGAVHDVMLAAYAINPQRPSFQLGGLLEEESLAAHDGVTPAMRMFELVRRQRAHLQAEGLEKLYEQVELPLAHTLYDMEKVGFLVDEAELTRLGDGFKARIESLSERIHDIAGADININSPKQLGDLLFGTLKLPGGKKTTTGYSTSAEILESIKDRHEIVPLILEYRKYFKLNSTYIDALIKLRDGESRIHTSFDQVATATGRLSSNEPNLQNIPVRTPEGREIRRAFVAQKGWVLVDADYSQIELRVLAHMAEDEVMMDAFLRGQDIHRRTAAEVYGVPIDAVTDDMRSAAKAVNFGIVYGISDFGLARNIGVSRGEASEFIARYFERYPAIKRYMDAQVAEGKVQGYVTTMFGRRRYVKELTSSNYNTRSFGERVAMNSPIQGTAADIIKIAMVEVDRALKAGHYRARLILQVHDELIVECPAEERERVERLLREAMEGAAKLDVPLVVDIGSGGDWHECKS